MCRFMVSFAPVSLLAAIGQDAGQTAAYARYGWLWLVPGGLFLLSIFLARRYNIAGPNRALLLARTADVKERAAAARLDVTRLDAIEQRFHGAWDKLADFFFWSRGEENADFKTLHFFELALLETPAVSPERVKARLETAGQQLALGDHALGQALATRIDGACKAMPPSSDSALRELLIEIQYYLYNTADTGYSTLTCWQTKSIWLMFVGLLLILTLGAAADRSVLFA